jgi:hypothetical protein
LSEVLHLPVRLTTEEQDTNLDLINRHTIDPVTLEDVFTFSGICSNDRLDAYFTRMDPSTTLKNYAEDLKTGVSLQQGHNIMENPYGRSYNGELILSDDGSGNAVRGHWYMIRNLEINGTNTNDAIRAIKAGIIRDMSIGFGGEKMNYRCGTCNRDLYDWECTHFPGLEDELGRMSFVWVVDARLREVSTVYKGATPGAYIDKARQYVEQGELSPHHIVKLERQYQVRLDDGKRSFFMPKKEEKTLNLLDQLRQALTENKLEKARVYEVLQGEGVPFRQEEDIVIRNELGNLANVEGIRQLKREAEQGQQYVADLIDQAVQARTRAQGDRFDAEKYRQMLVRANDIEFVKDEIKSYEDETTQRFTAGRQTEKEQMEPQPTKQVPFQDKNIFE